MVIAAARHILRKNVLDFLENAEPGIHWCRLCVKGVFALLAHSSCGSRGSDAGAWLYSFVGVIAAAEQMPRFFGTKSSRINSTFVCTDGAKITLFRSTTHEALSRKH